MSRFPERGDFVHLDFNPQTGHEQGGRRFGLVLSFGEYNDKSGLAFVAPITGQAKGYPFEVRIPDGGRCHGVVLVDHARSIDWRARNLTVVGHGPEELVEDAVARLAALIGA